MFDQLSRYANIGDATLTRDDGRIILYKTRRFIPASNTMRVMMQIRTTAADRLDLIAHRTIGDPTQYWRICDANNTIHPLELTDEPNISIQIPMPGK